MDKKNFSTSYIPLEKPYQIIKYGKDIGMQIGTLVASCLLEGDEDQSFRIETHSYPVVACANKMSTVTDKTFFALQPMEGVVWNRVELSDVVTICLTGEHITWQEFVNFLWTDIERTGYTAAPEYGAVVTLRNLGVDIASPPKGKQLVHLHLEENRMTKEKRICSSTKDSVVINIAWDEDLQTMKNRVMFQLMLWYLCSLEAKMEFPGKPKFFVSFESDDEIIAQLVSILNNLKYEDWDIKEIMRTVFIDLPLEKKTEVIGKIFSDLAKGKI